MDANERRNGMAMPVSDVIEEIDHALEADDTRIGDVFRAKRDGMTNAQFAMSIGATSHGFITNYNGFIESIRTGKVPDGASRRKDTRRAVTSFVERHRGELGAESRAWLEHVIAGLSRSGDARPAVNERGWVAKGSTFADNYFQTIQVDGDVYQLLVDQKLPSEPTLNDTLRRILS